MTSTTPPPSTPTPPITDEQIRRGLQQERPELLEQWAEEATLEQHLRRLALNAQWNWERNLAANRPSLARYREAGLLQAFSISQAIWCATPDDLETENLSRDDPDVPPLSEQQLRSGWFSI